MSDSLADARRRATPTSGGTLEETQVAACCGAPTGISARRIVRSLRTERGAGG
jgi:hypothetical protein